MTALIDISDQRILIANGGRSRCESHAWIRGGRLCFEDCRANARLYPRQISNRHWHLCDESPAPANDAGVRTQADIIWHQLSHLRQRHSLERVALALPPHYSRAQVELLLGIADAAGLRVRALASGALLAAAGLEAGGYLHLAVQQTQAVLSELDLGPQLVELRSSSVLPKPSADAIDECLLAHLQRLFIRQQRFDPLHHASTEQQLFNQIDDIVKGDSNAVTLSFNGAEYSLGMGREQLLAPALELMAAALPAGRDGRQLLGSWGRMAAPDNWRELADDAALHGLRVLLDGMAEDAAPQWPQSLAHRAAAPQPAAAEPAAPAIDAAVTHLLQDGVAVPLAHALVRLRDGRLRLDAGAEAMIDAALRVDGGGPLRVGGRLSHPDGGGTVQAIRVSGG